MERDGSAAVIESAALSSVSHYDQPSSRLALIRIIVRTWFLLTVRECFADVCDILYVLKNSQAIQWLHTSFSDIYLCFKSDSLAENYTFSLFSVSCPKSIITSNLKALEPRCTKMEQFHPRKHGYFLLTANFKYKYINIHYVQYYIK